MTSEREDEEWKGKLGGEIGKQEARHVFGSLLAMTERISFESDVCTCECGRVRVRRHTRVNGRVSIRSDRYYGVEDDDGGIFAVNFGIHFRRPKAGSMLDL